MCGQACADSARSRGRFAPTRLSVGDLGDSDRERHGSDAHRRAGRRRGAGGLGGGGVGGAERVRRAAGRRGGVPARQDVRRRAHPARGRPSCRSSDSTTGCAPTRSTRGCAPTGSARPCSCRGREAPCPPGVRPWRAPSSTTTCAPPRSRRAPRPSTARGRSAYAWTAIGSRPSSSPAGRASQVGGRAVRGRLRPAGRGRRRAVAARQAAGPRVASRDRLRRRRAQLRRLHDVRRPMDQLPPRAARRAGAGALGVRLDLPPRQRRGERRCRHPGHAQTAGRRRDQAADGPLRPATACRLRSRRGAADAHLGAAADGRRRVGCRRRQLGVDRRRGGLRQPAQRRGHRLRPRVRPPRRRDDGRARRPVDRSGRRCSATTTARRSRSPVAWPGSSPSRGCSRPSARPVCAPTG